MVRERKQKTWKYCVESEVDTESRPWWEVCGWCEKPGSSWQCPRSWCTRPPCPGWPGASRRSTGMHSTTRQKYFEKAILSRAVVLMGGCWFWPYGRRQLRSGPWRAHRSSWSCRARTGGSHPRRGTSQENPQCDLWPHATLWAIPSSTKSLSFSLKQDWLNNFLEGVTAEIWHVLLTIVSLAFKEPFVHIHPFKTHRLLQISIVICTYKQF